jgi:uncharacterized protein YcbK (DUF882 family)
MKVTDHFDSAEFACRDGRLYPEIWIEDRLRPLCQQLEVLRTAIDRPIVVISGYRSPEWNARVRGAKNSQHMEGRAADIRVADVDAGIVHARLLDLHAQGAIKIGGLGRYRTFTHVDIRPGDRLAQWSGKGIG